MGKHYRHLTYEDRKKIEKLCKKISLKDIAEVMEVSLPTICRELERCQKGNYRADEAQAHANELIQKRNDLKKAKNFKRHFNGKEGGTQQV